jgi:transposase InsO family protein
MLAKEYPTHLVCKVLDSARSSYYYQAQSHDETVLKAAIEAVAAEWPTYGYRRVTQELRQHKKLRVNHKRVRRLMVEMGLQVKRKGKKRQTTHSQHPFPRYPNLVEQLEIIRPDQVWVVDITYIRLGQGFIYLAVIMDVFTRAIRGWHLSRSLDQQLTLLALQRALKDHTPEIHHSDQGVQYAATAYTHLLEQAQVQISMAEVGAAWQNGYAERLIRTIKEEEVDLSDYQDYTEALRYMGRFLDEVYMHKRIHSSLGYLTPAEFERQWLQEHAQSQLMN